MSGQMIFERLMRGLYTTVRVNGRKREVHWAARCDITNAWVLTLRDNSTVRVDDPRLTAVA